MKETKTLDEMLDEILRSVMVEVLEADTGEGKYDINIELDDGDPCDDEDDDPMDEMYTELEFMVEISALMTDIAKGILIHCNDKLAELGGTKER